MLLRVKQKVLLRKVYRTTPCNAWHSRLGGVNENLNKTSYFPLLSALEGVIEDWHHVWWLLDGFS